MMETGIKEIKGYVHDHLQPKKGKVLMVVSSPVVSELTGWKIGFWASELTAPLLVFEEAGYDVDLASTEGGKVEMDGPSDPLHESGMSAHDIITLGYMQKDDFKRSLENTKDITEIDANEYDAIFLVGGAGPMYSFRGNYVLQNLFRSFYESGKPSATICHAATLLLEAKTSDGKLIVDGKSWTGFTNQEEKAAEQMVGQKVQPYWIEEEAKKLATTNFKAAPPFSSYVIADGNLITAQQQNSGAALARVVVEQLTKETIHG